MESSNKEATLVPPPPGIIGSLKAGFDTVAAHIAAILFPLALDLFLWLGPHISISRLFVSAFSDFKQLLADSGLSVTDIQNFDQIQTVINQVNIFNALRTFPIGLPSLISGKDSLQTPFGSPLTYQIGSVVQFYGLTFLLVFAGWVLGGLYFRRVSNLVMKRELQVSVGRALTQTIVYSFIWSLLFWTVGMIAALVFSIIFVLNPLIGQGLLLFVGFLSMWLVVPIFFSALGIFVRNQNAWTSIKSSFQMSRLTMPSSSLFVLTILMIGMGLNLLWAIPDDSSWLTLVGILGHAFVSTALLASAFVYYRDLTAWVQLMLERLHANVSTKIV
jgi:hypothetical protein